MKKSKFLCSAIILVSIVMFNLTAFTLAQRVFQQDILVTTFEDELNNIIANDTCSLREAIILINDRDDEKFGGCEYSSDLNDITNEPDVDLIPLKRIVLKEGTYELTRRIASVFSQSRGNLNIYEDVEIAGAGPDKTIIDGKGIQGTNERGGVIHAGHPPGLPGDVPSLGFNRFRIKDLSIINGQTKSVGQGQPPRGSAIYNDAGRNFVLDNVEIRNSLTNIEAVNTFSLTFKNSKCIDNFGGCIVAGSGSLIQNSVFKNSGIAIEISSGEINQSLFIENDQAIRANSPRLLTISDSTIIDNNPDEARAIEVVGQTTNSVVRLVNSIVAGNFSGTEQRNCSPFVFESEGFNLVGTDCSGFDEESDQTVSRRPKLGVNFAPLVGSLALDQGDSSCPRLDIYGNFTPIDGDGDGISRCDIGAVEQQLGQAQSDLALSVIDGPNGYFRGVQVDHVLELRNNGPLIANEILVEIPLPATASAISSTNANCSVNQGRVPFIACILNSLEADDTQLIPFSFTMDESNPTAVLEINVTVRGAVNDPIIANNSLDISLVPFDFSVAPVVSTSDLSFTKSIRQLESTSAKTDDNNVNALAFKVEGTNSTLTALNLKVSGTGNDASDLSSVKLWQDSNGDGLVDDGDVQLGQGKFNSDDGDLRLELASPLNLSEPVNLLITVDINSRLALNFTILMAFGLFGLGIVRRFRHNKYVNRGLTLVLVITLFALVSCGGQTTNGPKQPSGSAEQVSFQLMLESAEAIVPSSSTLNIMGLPIIGTELTVTE